MPMLQQMHTNLSFAITMATKCKVPKYLGAV